MGNRKPLGIQLFECARGSPISFRSCQALVLVLTFLSYASYHTTRKTTSIVKIVLDPKTNLGILHWPSHLYRQNLKAAENNMTLSSAWAPFNAEDGTVLLGEIDLSFLGVYAIGMFFAGYLGDRVGLRILLTIGMIGTGLFTAAFGAGYWFNRHNFYYFLGMQMMAGLFQSSGWPSVVAVVGNWFGKSKRGLIMGIWNAHASDAEAGGHPPFRKKSVGNISGSLIAAAMLKYGWSWSFAVPGIMIALVGLTVFLLLPVSPDVIGIQEDLHLKDSEKAGMDTLCWDRARKQKKRQLDLLRRGEFLAWLLSLSAFSSASLWPIPSCIGFPFISATQPLEANTCQTPRPGCYRLCSTWVALSRHPRRPHLRPAGRPGADGGELHLLRDTGALLLPHLRQRLADVEHRPDVHHGDAGERALRADHDGRLGRPRHAQLPERQLPGAGHRDGDHQRHGLHRRGRGPAADGVHLRQELERRVHDADGVGARRRAAADEARRGGGGGQDGAPEDARPGR